MGVSVLWEAGERLRTVSSNVPISENTHPTLDHSFRVLNGCLGETPPPTLRGARPKPSFSLSLSPSLEMPV